MADFPTLSVQQSEPYDEQFTEVGDLASPVEAGYVLTRRQFTRRTKDFLTTYDQMTDADKATMMSFIDTYGTTGAFNWTPPLAGSPVSVRFKKIPKISRKDQGWIMSPEFRSV